MQQYRINYRLLIGLFVGVIVLAVLLGFLWSWQVNRKASWYRDTADAALLEDDTLKAFQYMQYFVQLRRDNDEARVKLASIAVDVLKKEGIPREDKRKAFGYLADTVRRTNDETTRRNLADLYFEWNNAQQAQIHYEELMKTSDDPELKSRYVRTLFMAKDYQNALRMAYELIGFDPETEAFDDEKAEAPNLPEVYAVVAGMFIDRENDEELAKKVIDKMVEVNPDSAIARFQYSRFLYADDKEASTAELEKAYELDPENPEILLWKIQLALQDDDPNQAIELAKSGIAKFPNSIAFYVNCARAYQAAEMPEKAVDILDKGILEFGEQLSVGLFREKFDVLLASGDTEGCLKVIGELEDLKEQELQPLIDYEKARITFSQGNWRLAARQLRKVRSQLVADRGLQIHAGFMLADSYKKLGMKDKALEYYRILAGDESISDSVSFKRLAINEVAKLEKAMKIGSGAEASDLASVIERENAKDPEDQDWEKINELVDKLAERSELSDARILVVKADIYRMRGMLDEAKEKIREAAKLDPDQEDVTVQMAAVGVLLDDLPKGPAQAKRLLARIESKFGITMQTRSNLIQAIVRSGGDDLKAELLAVAEGLEGVEEISLDDKSRLLEALGDYFMKLGELEQAESLTLQAAELAPGSLPTREQLFSIALARKDENAIERAQQMILDVVQSKDDAAYILTEARRQLLKYQSGEASLDDMEKVRRMLDMALEERPQWHELHIIYAQVLLALRQDMKLVLQHFDDALKYGPPNPRALAQQVSILSESGMKDQAQERMKLMPDFSRNLLLGKVEADILLAAGDIEAAFESAKKTVERNSKDPRLQAWFAQIAESAEKLPEAAEGYKRATQLNPKSEQYWRKLLTINAKLDDLDGLITTLRSAQLALEPELIPEFQSMFFELQQQWKNSEKIHLSIYGDDYETNPTSAQRLANFYFRWGAKNKDVIPRAYPYVNAMLKAGLDGTLKPNSPTLIWAQERAALALSSKNNYRDFLKSLQVIRQGSSDGSIPESLMPLYLKILTSRSDPKSISEAISLLTPRYKQGTLSKDDEMLLANLYERTHQWEKGKDLMLDALSKYKGDPKVWTNYINLLIKQGEYSSAKGRINRFEDVANSPGTIARMRASLAYEQGDSEGVKRALRSLMPPGGIQGALSENDLQMIKAVAAMAVEFGEYAVAEQLLKVYVQRKSPDGLFNLVSLLATQGNVEQAINMMEKVFPSNPLGVAQLSVQALRERARDLNEIQIDNLWSFVARVVDERPEDPERLLMRAEANEVIEKYDKAIADYEAALELRLDPVRRAIALNNLAYLLANTGQRFDEAEEMIQGAIDVLGPLSDIMDTRAVIRMARKEYDLAVKDMGLALSVDPTASKYYHLAQANALAGNTEEALKAWDSARELGIEKEDLPLMEQPGYDDTERLIEQLQNQ